MRGLRSSILALAAALILFTVFVSAAEAAPRQVRTVVLGVVSNSAGDGHIVQTEAGDFDLAYGAGGYGKYGEIYDLVLESMDRKVPVVLTLGPEGIEDVSRGDQ